jgi:hypothetical protein
MANKKISDLDALTAATIVPATDVLVLEDISDKNKFKKATPAAVVGSVSTAVSTPALYGTDTGNDDDYAVTLSPAPAALTTGMLIAMKATTTNTSGATITVNGLTQKAITIGGAALTSGDIRALAVSLLLYDGTNFELLNPARD